MIGRVHTGYELNTNCGDRKGGHQDSIIYLLTASKMAAHRYFVALLLCLALNSFTVANASSSPESAARTCSLFSAPATDEQREAVLSDIRSSLDQVNDEQQCTSDSVSTQLSSPTANAIDDFTQETSKDGRAAHAFLRGLAQSPTFRDEYWHKRPLHIRSSDIFTGDDETNKNNNWIAGTFTVEHHLKQIDGSYINGHCTAEILRNGTKTDTWAFRSLKENPARPTTWAEVEQALQDGTVYFNNAGSLWPNLGALCRLAGYAFGLPDNVNVYVTPQGCAISVPPHTDKQDVLCFQTQGTKRWRVYAPPLRKKGVDPMNRGKNGDVVDINKELGEPLIDAVIRKGDVLYVPQGFPHTTDTVSATGMESNNKNVFDEISVHLTMGLDSNVWFLTYAHLRWALLQRVGKEYRIEIKSDESYWNSMETISIGFLAGDEWDRIASELKETGSLDEEYVSSVIQSLKEVMVELEPERWGATTEDFPSDDEFTEVITYVVRDHAQALMDLQEDMFTDVDPQSDDTIMKAYQCTQKQNEIMERFGKFSKNEAMKQSFAQTRAKRDMLAKNNNS